MSKKILEIKNKIKNCIIIHGCPDNEEKAMNPKTRTYDKHWLPWIKNELEKVEFRVDFPLMPHPWNPSYKDHKKEFEKLDINESSILIGTSCGTTFLLRWLGETRRKVKAFIMVAPWYNPKYDNKGRDFYDFKIDKSVKDRVKNIIMFIADNEGETGKRSAKIFAEKLDPKVISISGYGHYIESHMKTDKFPELLKEVIDI
ncbi:hypothetical protein HOD96_03810 [Candidatus Falkowbacteria bacterium]|nr:hypothetical protein [Candidatus Falkowbacteria bacterium]MBT4432895.1 hypothetical protein [Candidatus Falkowbacteria bacterium]